ncbi:S41 family peptidase [Spirosoma daeguense]
MKSPCLLFFLLLRVSTFAQTIPAEELKNDLIYFRKALEEVHPAMYRYTPKPTFDSLFSATSARINRSMTQQEFYVTMTPLVAALRDGHTKWIPAQQDEHYPFATDKLFPLQLYVVGNRAWIRDNYGRVSVPNGAEILQINGQSMADIITTLLPDMTFADGFAQTAKYGDLNNFFSGYYATYIAAPDTFNVMYRQNGRDVAVTLPAVTKQAITTFKETHKPTAKKAHRITFIRDSTSQSESNTAILTIERFWSENGEIKFKQFLKDAFRQIQNKKTTNLVLDLRNNEGGEESLGVLLYSYLISKSSPYYERIVMRQKNKPSFPAWTPKIYRLARGLAVKKRDGVYQWTWQRGLKTVKPKTDTYRGQLYVLLNGYSFSVTTELASRLRSDKRAVFIGEETGGGYVSNSSGFFAVTNLPNSKIDLGIPLMNFQMANVDATLPNNRGILPDHTVVPTIEDVLKNNDPVLNQALSLAKKAQPATSKSVFSRQ